MLKNELRRDNNNNNTSTDNNSGRPTPSAPSLDEINNNNHHNNIHDIDDENHIHNNSTTSRTTSLLQHLQNIPIQLQQLYHNHFHPRLHTTTSTGTTTPTTTTNTSNNNTTTNIHNHDDDNNWKPLFQVFCFIFILYIAFGGRFGLSSDIYNRANYGSGNAYDEFYNSGRSSRKSMSSSSSSSSSSRSWSCNSGDDVNSDSCKTKDYFDNSNTGDTYHTTKETYRQNTYHQQPRYNYGYNDGDNYNNRGNNQYYGDRYSSYGEYGSSSNGRSGGNRNYHYDQPSSYGSYSSRNNRGRQRSDSVNWDAMIPYVIVGGIILLLNKVLGVPIHFMPLGFGLNRGLGGHIGGGGMRFGFGPGGGIRFGLGPGGLGLGGGYYGGGGRFHRRRHNRW